MKNSIELKSYKAALTHFIELCDKDIKPEDTVRIFRELKEKGVAEYANQPEFWRGNHDQSQTTNKIYLIDSPLRFYVVESEIYENSCDFRGTRTQRWVYVPEY